MPDVEPAGLDCSQFWELVLPVHSSIVSCVTRSLSSSACRCQCESNRLVSVHVAQSAEIELS